MWWYDFKWIRFCGILRKCESQFRLCIFIYEVLIYYGQHVSANLKVKIYRTTILPLVLYGCETWSLTLREERRLRVFFFKLGCWGGYLGLKGTR